MIRPLVSIIIPAYNCEKYIEQTLKSLINQTLKDIEIIVINDGSSDNTESIIKKYIDIDKRIKLINQNNLGVAIARNRGIKESTGKYISFVDHDDCVDEKLYEKLVKGSKKLSVDIVKCGFSAIEDLTNRELYNMRFKLNEDQIYNKDFIWQNIIKSILGISYNKMPSWLKNKNQASENYNFVWASIYKSELIKGNDIKFSEQIVLGEDTYFNLRAFAKANSFTIINEKLYFWRQFNESTSKKFDLNAGKKRLDTLEAKKEFCDLYKLDDSFRTHYRGQGILLILFYIFNLCRRENTLTYKQNIHIIKDMMKKDIVKECCEGLTLNGYEIKYKIPLFLIKIRAYRSLYILCKIATNININPYNV